MIIKIQWENCWKDEGHPQNTRNQKQIDSFSFSNGVYGKSKNSDYSTSVNLQNADCHSQTEDLDAAHGINQLR